MPPTLDPTVDIRIGDTRSIDSLETELIQCEALVASLRARQGALLRGLDVAQVCAVDGARTLVDWTASRLDIEHDAARRLVGTARALPEHDELASALEAGEMTMDRVAATIKLIASGASSAAVDASLGLDLAGVRRLTANHKRMTRTDEREVFRERYWASQHSLDQGRGRFWGEMTAFDLDLVEKALHQRSDSLPTTPEGVADRRPRRMVDALVAMSLDTIDPIGAPADTTAGNDRPNFGGNFGGNGGRIPLATVFVDAGLAAGSGGEAGAALAFGARVGPDLLDQILCGGAVQVIGVHEGRPVTVTDETQAIPPAIRRFVAHRDGGCVIDGCTSRYRLQPHHVRHRRHGGTNDPDGLALLCWYHHHVVIHRHGFRLDPGSPPHRRRFLRKHHHGPAPP